MARHSWSTAGQTWDGGWECGWSGAGGQANGGGWSGGGGGGGGAWDRHAAFEQQNSAAELKVRGRGAKRRRAAGERCILVVLDMNGVLLNRAGKSWGNATLRPHLDVLLETFRELSGTLMPAVWSSMVKHNLHPLVDLVFGQGYHDKGKGATELAFVLDQEWCTKKWVPGMNKPLLRKDLEWLCTTEWSDFMPDHVLLVDDDPVKCTENPEGSAVHPSSYEGKDEDAAAGTDTELLRLSGYLRALAASGSSVPDFVKSTPYEDFSDVIPTGPLVKSARDDPYVERAAEPPAKRARAGPAEPATRGKAKAEVAEPKQASVYWPDSDEWLSATVVETLSDGSYRVAWDEDGSESVVPPDYVSWL